MNPRQLVRSWLSGRASLDSAMNVRFAAPPGPGLGTKLRRAYHWIADQAVHVPFHDIDLSPPVVVGKGENRVEFPRDQACASFILLPLLNLIMSRRLVFVGGPGRGKTTMATLMAVLAGAPLDEVRQAVQHGHPQLTLADLLGGPLPGDLLKAERPEDIRVRWRRWITAPVKIIDEYNRIPTKTQSALLSLMAEGYAELYEQVVHCGRSAWYLTANDDQGGGTFPVIEALRDRIDLVVRCTPFHAGFLDSLADRVSRSRSPEESVPADLVLTPEEFTEADAAVRRVEVPAPVRDVLGFLLGQLDFCQRASTRLELRNKDTLHLAGRRVGHVCTEDCPLDKNENLCSQTEAGVSARAVQTLLHCTQALAFFRGRTAVGLDDVRALMPWVFHDKLANNPQSAFFQQPDHQVYLTDRVSWIQQLFDKAVVQYAAFKPSRQKTMDLRQACVQGLGGATTVELGTRLGLIQERAEQVLSENELNAVVNADLVLLKDLYVRCRAELDRRAAER